MRRFCDFFLHTRKIILDLQSFTWKKKLHKLDSKTHWSLQSLKKKITKQIQQNTVSAFQHLKLVSMPNRPQFYAYHTVILPD